MKSVWKDHPVLRRIPLGLIMGAYIWGLTPWADKVSGAHINPAVTWTYFRLGRLNLMDSLLYTLAQFTGALAGHNWTCLWVYFVAPPVAMLLAAGVFLRRNGKR